MGFLLWAADCAAFFLILYITLFLRTGGGGYSFFAANVAVFIPVFILATFISWIFSFYDAQALKKRNPGYKFFIAAFLASAVISSAFIYFAQAKIFELTPKTILLAVLFFYFVYMYYSRRHYFKLNFAKTTVIIFGKSPTIDEIVKEISRSNLFTLLGYAETPCAQRNYDLKNLDGVIFGSKLFLDNRGSWNIIADRFISAGIRVNSDFNIYETIFSRASRESIEDSVWLLRGIAGRRENYFYNPLKRFVDVAVSLALLPFLAAAGVFIYFFVRIADGYNPLFIQKRVGFLEKPITVYKFRTLPPGGTEADITKTGRFLRRFRLDEIPQIINVLKGDISFVGPRPIWANEHDFLNQHVPNHKIRTIVKPGITGWAQLNFKAPPTYFHLRGKQPETLEKNAFCSAFTRFSYDVWYIKNRSVLLDMEILCKTAIRMFIKDKNIA